MEDIRGGLIVNVQNTHAEYREELEGVKFFLMVQMDGITLNLMVWGYRPCLCEGGDGMEVFEGECDDLYPTPADISYPAEDDEAWDALEGHYASLLARDARLTISDEEVRLEIGKSYSSILTDYEVLGDESEWYNEDDAPYMEDDAGLWSIEGDTSYPEDDVGFVP